MNLENNDPNNPRPQELETPIASDLEARVVAWVAGEASAFEVAELERVCGEKPELAIFKRRIEAVHGLVGEAARPTMTPLRMAEERRAKLLETLRSAEARGSGANAGTGGVVSLAAAGRRNRRIHRWLMAAAACVPLAGLLFVLTMPADKKGAWSDRAAIVFNDEMARSGPTAVAVKLPQVDEAVQLSPFEVRSESKLGRMVADARARLRKGQIEEREAEERNERVSSTRPAPVNAPAPQVEHLARAEPRDQVAAQSPAAPAASDDSAKVQLKIDDPRPLFAGTPRPIRVPNLEASGGLAQSGPVAAVESLTLGEPPKNGGVRAGMDAFASAEIGVGQAHSAGSGQARFGAVGDSATFNSAAGPKPSSSFSGAITLGGAASAPRENNASPLDLAAGAAPAVRDESTVTLQAFEVSADKDTGTYRTAAIAGAGGRQESAGSTSGKPAAQGLDEVDAKRQVARGAEEQKKSMAQKQDEDGAKRPSGPPPLKPSVEETSAAKEPVSTFSLHVSDVSFRLAQAALARGEAPDPARIRPEEFYNAFDYGDPTPGIDEKISCRFEQAAHPFLHQRNFVRIAMKVGSSGRGVGTPLRLTVLLDTSGSMEREDRAAAVRRAMQVLVSLLGANDRITLIGFARTPRLLAENVAGNTAGQLLDLMARTPAEGGTNLEEALKLAGELARRHRQPGAQNRIVLLTDGAANLGDADPARLGAAIETLRQQGIAFDACGVGSDGIDDEILERLTRKGDGRYYVLDTPEAADVGFARQLAGAFRPAAENVKVQVRFNPARVASYRLIGFEQHRLREEDFRNDRVDAAELAAEEAAVALYQVEPLPQGEGELGEVFVRFRDPATGAMVERSWTMSYDARASAFDRATPTLQLAGTVALLAEKLRASPLAGQFKLGDLVPVVNALRGRYANQPRVQELAAMFAQMRRMAGE